MNSEKKGDQLVKKFSDGITQLDEVLEGLSDSELDISRSKGKWTIRQIAHHIAEFEDLYKMAIKAALGNPGCTFNFDWYIADNKWAAPLWYNTRPITIAMEIFRISRQQVLELINFVDNAWEKPIYISHQSMPEKMKFTVKKIIKWQVLHLEMHIKQIKDTRKTHGL